MIQSRNSPDLSPNLRWCCRRWNGHDDQHFEALERIVADACSHDSCQGLQPRVSPPKMLWCLDPDLRDSGRDNAHSAAINEVASDNAQHLSAIRFPNCKSTCGNVFMGTPKALMAKKL